MSLLHAQNKGSYFVRSSIISKFINKYQTTEATSATELNVSSMPPVASELFRLCSHANSFNLRNAITCCFYAFLVSKIN